MKRVNIYKENLHIIWTTWENSMNFSGNMSLMIILKVTNNQAFALPLDDTCLEKSNWSHPPAFLRLRGITSKIMLTFIAWIIFIPSEQIKLESHDKTWKYRFL